VLSALLGLFVLFVPHRRKPAAPAAAEPAVRVVKEPSC
jgi:hypothetical protein